MPDRSRFTTEKVEVVAVSAAGATEPTGHDCQAIAANSQGLTGKSSSSSSPPSFVFAVVSF